MRQAGIALLSGCVLSVLLLYVPSHRALASDDCCTPEATAKIRAKAAGALVGYPEYLAWKNFAPGAKVVYAARYWNLASSNKFLAGPITSLKAYQLRVINAESFRLWFSEAPTDRYGRPMPPNEWEETIAAQYDSNVSPSANQSRSAQLLTVFHQAGNLAVGVRPNSGPIETGEDTIEVNGARIATHWESATYEYDVSVWPTFKNCRLVIKLWTSDAVPTGLVRKTEDRTCPLGGDQLARVISSRSRGLRRRRASEPYHVVNCGNGRAEVFHAAGDYQAFVNVLS
jgi:hypothetical protein